MSPLNGTYSSAQLRERDQRVNETRQKEIDSLNAKIQKLKQNYDSVSSELFSVANRERRLIEALGFESVYEAQIAIDSTDYPISFRNCMERVQTAEAQSLIDKKEVELLQAKLRDIEGENKLLMAKHQTLESRYTDMEAVKTRAAERYKADFKVWQGTHNWLYSGSKNPINQPGVTPEALKILEKARLLKRRQQLLERGPIPPPTDPENFEAECEKENEGTPVPPTKKRRISSLSSSVSTKSTTSTLPLRNVPLKSVTNMAPPSCSPTVFNNPDIVSNTRIPLTFQPIPGNIAIDKEPSCTPSPINDDKPSLPLLRSSPLSAPHIPASSDTEDDSQAVFLPSNNTPAGRLAFFKVPAPPPPKAGPSQYHTPSGFSDPILPNRSSQSSHAPGTLWDPATLELSCTMNTHQKLDADRVKSANASRPTDQRTARATKLQNQVISLSSSVKGKEREVEAPFSSPLTSRNSGQKRLEDYSVFKGRGRYGKADESAQPTINALYAIDPTRNGGVNYQYDEVVRRRDDRQKMDAGDCECCREYYERVGALPSRLQQPLWRSPPATPARPCQRHSHSPADRQRSEKQSNHRPGSARRQSEVESHKKAISRHRHIWARARTPPGYWDIGFPNTQEVGNINQKAKEMHKRKKDDVDREAAIEGGKYRRK